MNPQQLLSYAILLVAVAALAAVTWRSRGSSGLTEAGKAGGGLFLSVLPNLILGFTLAGLLQVVLPRDAIARWMGDGSGWRGLAFGSVAGMLTPGGPFTHFPILAGFLRAGAGVGPVAAYIAGWALLGLNRIVVWEIPILGWRFVLARFVACLLIPPTCGWLTGHLYRFANFLASRSQV